jgi:hypothetical protein
MKPRKVKVQNNELPYFGIDPEEVVALRALARAVYDYLYKDDSEVCREKLAELLEVVKQIKRKRNISN